MLRTRRFRPSVGLRPSFDLLMPRIAPSDITVIVYTNQNPTPDDTNDPPPPPPSPEPPAVGC